MSYAGSRSGSRDNLDDPPVASPRDPSYERQYAPRNPPPPQPRSRGAPPAYTDYATESRPPVDRYAERAAPRSHSPQRYGEERPQDQYYPSRSHSPASYARADDAQPARYPPRDQSPATRYPPRDPSPAQYGGYRGGQPAARRDYQPAARNYSPARSTGQAAGGYYNPSMQQPSPQSTGYPASTGAGYSTTGGGYPTSQSGAYSSGGYQPQRHYTPSQYSGYSGQPASRYPARPGAPGQYGYRKMPQSYQKKEKHKSVTKDGGYYNVYTDAVVKTRKLRTKTGPATFLAVTRPWSKNHSNQPRDFMPLVIASIFFNPLVGFVALILSCITKRAVTRENWAKAGKYGRITFWMAIAAMISGIIFFMALIGAVHNYFIPPGFH